MTEYEQVPQADKHYDDYCESCMDEEPVRRDPVTGLLYHISKDPVGGRTTYPVCTNKTRQNE